MNHVQVTVSFCKIDSYMFHFADMQGHMKK